MTNSPFQRTWDRTDKPVADGVVERTWMWGLPHSEEMQEEYFQSPGQQRTVQYFDKARMELTHPDGDPDSIWYVTNGLLVVEMITGQMQVNDFPEDSQVRIPAMVNVAGDANDPNGPTYATFLGLLDAPPATVGTALTTRLSRDGKLSEHKELGAAMIAAYLDEVTQHAIAEPFWEFMNSEGTVWESGQNITDTLFENPFYATGRPITEAYWADVVVAGTEQLVLIQCFERRCLTFTPGNEPGWQVEAGNVGQHYYAWRYAETDATGQLLGTGWVTSAEADRTVSNIFAYNPDGTDVINLSGDNNEVNDQFPVWSPDGTKVAFQRGPEWDSHIFVVDADGSNLTQLTDDGYSFRPAWSPDSTTIAFERRYSEDQKQIFLMDADGANQRQLTSITVEDDDWGSASYPAWSPDGTQIAFTGAIYWHNPYGHEAAVFVINPDGTGLARLTEGVDASHPVWSPDGSMISFVQRGGGGHDMIGSRLFVMQADGSDLNEIRWELDTQGRNDHFGASWSPDSSQLVYKQAGGLVITNPDGSEQQMLLGPGSNRFWQYAGIGVTPQWSPDGEHIAFNFFGSYVIHADGGNPAYISDAPSSVVQWKPQ